MYVNYFKWCKSISLTLINCLHQSYTTIYQCANHKVCHQNLVMKHKQTSQSYCSSFYRMSWWRRVLSCSNISVQSLYTFTHSLTHSLIRNIEQTNDYSSINLITLVLVNIRSKFRVFFDENSTSRTNTKYLRILIHSHVQIKKHLTKKLLTKLNSFQLKMPKFNSIKFYSIQIIRGKDGNLEYHIIKV